MRPTRKRSPTWLRRLDRSSTAVVGGDPDAVGTCNVQMRTFHPGRIYGMFRPSYDLSLHFSARPRPPVISNGASRLFSSASLLRSGQLAQREISLLLFLFSAFLFLVFLFS